MHCAVSGQFGLIVFKTVDIFNATSGVWTTATLSVARTYLAATSLPNYGLAIFAGGVGASYLLMAVIARGRCVGRVRVCGRGEVGCWLVLLLIADAKRRYSWDCFSDCGHLQCDERCVDQRQPQRRSTRSCSHIAAELRTGDLRRRPRCVVCVDYSDRKGMVCGEGEVVGPLLLIAYALRRCQFRCCQHCGHLQCDQRCVDHCCPQRRSR